MGQESVAGDVGDKRHRVLDTTKQPYSGIAYLHGVGTAFLVSHEERLFLATAAHCLWDNKKNKAKRDKIQISLGMNAEERPFGTIRKKAVDFRVPREYKAGGGREFDFGIIRLDKEKYKLSNCVAFGLEPRTDDYIESQDLYMSGYPTTPKEQKDGDPGWPPHTQWEIKLTKVTVNDKSLQYRDATTPGNSGSPVYEMKDGRYVAHGIHTSGIDENHASNEAFRIDVAALMELVKKAYIHKKKRPHGHQITSDASGSSSSRSSTLDSFTSGSSTSTSSTLGSPISGSPLQNPPLQDPQPQDPPLMDPQPQDPQLQDPPLQDPQPQDPPLQDPPLLGRSPQQNRKAPKDNHSEPPKLSWFKRLCKTVKSWFHKVCETVKRWFR